MRSQSVLQREVSAAVNGLNWPPLAARGWAPLPALAAFPSPAGGDAGGGGGGGGRGGGGGGGKTLKILTWNVLCDGLSGAHPERGGFIYAPEGSLDWEKRRCGGSRWSDCVPGSRGGGGATCVDYDLACVVSIASRHTPSELF